MNLDSTDWRQQLRHECTVFLDTVKKSERGRVDIDKISEVLDVLVGWSLANESSATFKSSADKKQNTARFLKAGTKSLLWEVYPGVVEETKIEFLTRTAGHKSPQDRERLVNRVQSELGLSQPHAPGKVLMVKMASMCTSERKEGIQRSLDWIVAEGF